ncbi:MAG: hypothetical protein GX883_10305 [Firmicutes bacterium]|nr:hypothetical protein [Bacillota bacterium]
MRRGWGLFILGLIAGALLIHLYQAKSMETLYRQREKLKVELFETTERLTRSEALWADRPEEKIRSIELSINGAKLDDLVRLELKRLSSEIAAALIGSPAGGLEPEVAVSLLHGRKLTVEGKDYQIAVDWIVIAPKTLINLSAAPVPADR